MMLARPDAALRVVLLDRPVRVHGYAAARRRDRHRVILGVQIVAVHLLVFGRQCGHRRVVALRVPDGPDRGLSVGGQGPQRTVQVVDGPLRLVHARRRHFGLGFRRDLEQRRSQGARRPLFHTGSYRPRNERCRRTLLRRQHVRIGRLRLKQYVDPGAAGARQIVECALVVAARLRVEIERRPVPGDRLGRVVDRLLQADRGPGQSQHDVGVGRRGLDRRIELLLLRLDRVVLQRLRARVQLRRVGRLVCGGRQFPLRRLSFGGRVCGRSEGGRLLRQLLVQRSGRVELLFAGFAVLPRDDCRGGGIGNLPLRGGVALDAAGQVFDCQAEQLRVVDHARVEQILLGCRPRQLAKRRALVAHRLRVLVSDRLRLRLLLNPVAQQQRGSS